MQLGMIGLGRMGANIVRRLMRDGHECVVYDVNEAAIAQLESEGATGARTLAEFAAKLTTPRAAWIMVPAAICGRHRRASSRRCFERGDIIIDGGNSYYRDDIDRAKRLEPLGHPLRRRRHERRRLRARARLLHDDRRRGPRSSRTSIRSSARSRPASTARPARPGAAAPPRRPSTATCTAAATAPGTS